MYVQNMRRIKIIKNKKAAVGFELKTHSLKVSSVYKINGRGSFDIKTFSSRVEGAIELPDVRMRLLYRKLDFYLIRKTRFQHSRMGRLLLPLG